MNNFNPYNNNGYNWGFDPSYGYNAFNPMVICSLIRHK